ncbi:zincin-like metallopeptidase toxin domain-containing protein [Capnocytophaga gingivalis]
MRILKLFWKKEILVSVLVILIELLFYYRKKFKQLRGKPAGYNRETKTIYINKKPAKRYYVLHESYHARQHYKLGDEKYKAQSRLEKEEYVYDELMKNHKEQLTDYQISGARKYLDEVREEHIKEIAKKLK